jgi:hypothetical protein
VGVFGQTQLAAGALAGLDPFLQTVSMHMFAAPITVAHRQQRPTIAVFQTDSACRGKSYGTRTLDKPIYLQICTNLANCFRAPLHQASRYMNSKCTHEGTQSEAKRSERNENS